MKYDGSMYAYVKKAEKIDRLMMKKVATIRKSKTHNRQSKSRPISVCACFIPYTLNKYETWCPFNLNSCKQILGLERPALLWSAPAGT